MIKKLLIIPIKINPPKTAIGNHSARIAEIAKINILESRPSMVLETLLPARENLAAV